MKDLGLNLSVADGDLKGLMREAHIILNDFFSVSDFVKVYENSKRGAGGSAWEELPS